MAGKLSMLRGRAKRIATAACASALALFALTSVAMPSTAVAAEEPAFQPDVKKEVTANTDSQGKPDGTYTVSLSVTGKQKSTEETVNRKADVILVIDTSTSMTSNPFGTDGKRFDAAKKAAKQLINHLVPNESSDDVRIAIVPFATRAQFGKGFQSSNEELLQEVRDLRTSGQDRGGDTNWESAMGVAADVYATARKDAQKYVVFLSDGAPTSVCKRKDNNNRELSYAGDGKWKQGNTIVSESDIQIDYYNEYGNPLYIEGLFPDAAAEYVVSCGANAAKKMEGATFFSVSLGSEGTLDNRMKSFQAKVTGNSDSSTNGYYSGTDSESLLKAFGDISQSIVKTAAFQDVVITDTLNAQYAAGFESNNADAKLLDAGVVDPSTFTYTQKVAGEEEEYWNPTDKQKASFNQETGEIVWDLSTVGDNVKLPADVTYKVSFKIAPTQAAFDEAGKNGKDFTFDSNGVASASFKPVTTVNGEDQVGEEAKVALPTGKMTARLSTLIINKVWPTDEDHSTGFVTVNFKDTNNVAYTAVLSAPTWTANVKVPAGPDGNTYTNFEEVDVPGYQASYNKSAITLKGFTPQSDSLTVTNTRKTGSLSITKFVSGGAANTTQYFTFTLSASGDSLTQLTGSYPATYKMNDGTEPDKDQSGHPALITFINGKAEVQLRHNETVTINDLPADVTITVKETSKNQAYETTESKLGTDEKYTLSDQLDATVVALPTDQTHVYFKNTANAAPDNGISSDSSPMVELFAAAAIGGTALYAVNRGKRGQDAWKE